MYTIPADYFFRLHHVRPRFKKNIENVLAYMAFTIVELDGLKNKKFKDEMSEAIRSFSGNEDYADKTIQNWRTEISALFSMIKAVEDKTFATDIAKELADTSNLRRFFLRIVLTFQYPGGFLKPREIAEVTSRAVLFSPCLWISEFFTSDLDSNEKYITDVEFCHCVLNDLRVTADNESIGLTTERILYNRKHNIEYNAAGDTKRYALDLLDYFVLAGILMKDYQGKYFLREETIPLLSFFKKNHQYFEAYQHYTDIKDIASIKNDWISYVNNQSYELLYKFDQEYTASLADSANDDLAVYANTKQIGDKGEALTLAHEKIWLAQNNRPDLVRFVQHIPTQFAMGYDVSSRELNTNPKHIEVKTTLSEHDLTIHRVHLTPNEWAVAEGYRDSYYIYRVQITENRKTLWVIKDPVGLYKKDKLKMTPRDGADLTFDETCYEEVELLEYSREA